jgi:hypothetical protein
MEKRGSFEMRGHRVVKMVRLPVDVRVVRVEVPMMTEDHLPAVRLMDLLWGVDQMARTG